VCHTYPLEITRPTEGDREEGGKKGDGDEEQVVKKGKGAGPEIVGGGWGGGESGVMGGVSRKNKSRETTVSAKEEQEKNHKQRAQEEGQSLFKSRPSRKIQKGASIRELRGALFLL